MIGHAKRRSFFSKEDIEKSKHNSLSEALHCMKTQTLPPGYSFGEDGRLRAAWDSTSCYIQEVLKTPFKVKAEAVTALQKALLDFADFSSRLPGIHPSASCVILPANFIENTKFFDGPYYGLSDCSWVHSPICGDIIIKGIPFPDWLKKGAGLSLLGVSSMSANTPLGGLVRVFSGSVFEGLDVYKLLVNTYPEALQAMHKKFLNEDSPAYELFEMDTRPCVMEKSFASGLPQESSEDASEEEQEHFAP